MRWIAAWIGAGLLLLLVSPVRGEDDVVPPARGPGSGPQVTTAAVTYADDRPAEEIAVLVTASDVWLKAQDLTAFFRGTRTWRTDIRKMVLQIADHEIAVVVGSEVAILDGEEARHLTGPVVYREGQVYLPLSLFFLSTGEPRPWLPQKIQWFAAEKRLKIGEEAAAGLTAMRIESGDRLDLILDRAYDYRLVSAARNRFILRIPGASFDPDSLTAPAGSERFLALAAAPAAGGSEISFAVPEDVLGYQILRLEKPTRIAISLSSDERAIREGRLTPFAGSGFETRAIRIVVIDPGHGGDDPGASTAGGVVESEATLALAQDIARRLEDQLGLTAILTRDADRALTIEQRVDAANVAGADLFVSLHFDSYASPSVRGPRAVVARPPSGAPGSASGPLKDLGFQVWGDAQRGEVNRAYILADRLVGEVAAALDLPARGVEEWPLPLLTAATMPAVFLEIDALSSDRADQWLANPERRLGVAEAVVTAIDRYRRESP